MTIQKARYRDKLNYEIVAPAIGEERLILKLVLQPIVENAIYHGIKEQKGPGHITITGKETDGCLIIRVEDDGAGMDGDALAQISDQLKKRESTEGYGMINVHERIALTFGEAYGLTVESQKGAGTAVTIRLPILKKEWMQLNDKWRVLIADDEPWIREGIRDAVSWERYYMEVSAEAENGEEAFELALQHSIDLLIVDLNMPIVNGLNLMKKLRQALPRS